MQQSVAAGVAVPALLALLSAIQLATHQRATEYLLLPPFAVIVYLIFRFPRSASARFRSVVVLPCIGAVMGQICSHYFGLTPAGVAIATGTVLLAHYAMGAEMPPALALAVLAMFLRAEGWTYVVGVAEGTSLIFVAFVVFERFANASWR